jgi:hypothetical protein
MNPKQKGENTKANPKLLHNVHIFLTFLYLALHRSSSFIRRTCDYIFSPASGVLQSISSLAIPSQRLIYMVL